MRGSTTWCVRRAQVSDVPTMLVIFDEAATWLIEHNLTGQWGSRLPSQQPDFAERLQDWVSNHLVLLALDNANYAHGCIIVGFDAPPYLEPNTAQATMHDAGYVYSLASRKKDASSGVGAILLDRAAQEVEERGKHYIRLDCWANNAALCAYYQRAGFVFCGSYKEGDWHGALMEKELKTSKE